MSALDLVSEKVCLFQAIKPTRSETILKQSLFGSQVIFPNLRTDCQSVAENLNDIGIHLFTWVELGNGG